MTKFTQFEVEALCLRVGARPRVAKIFSAIALCESPVFSADPPQADFSLIGDQELANDVWGYSYGGFQIRSLREQRGTGGPRDEERLLIPWFNARSARIIRNQSGWDAWSTYSSGMYLAYLQDIHPPAPGTYNVVAGDTLSGIVAKYGGTFSVEELASFNDIEGPKYLIMIGQVLRLPVY